MRQRHRENPACAQQVQPRFAREMPGDGGVARVEAAGIGAERRQHQFTAVLDEASAGDIAALVEEAGLRVEMAADFIAGAGGGFMPETHAGAFVFYMTGETRRHEGAVMIAANPQRIVGEELQE